MRTPTSSIRIRHAFHLPLLSALLASLIFPPTSQEWLVWVVWVPLLIWLAEYPQGSFRRAFPSLLLVGTIYHVVLLAPFCSLAWWGWGAMSEEAMRSAAAFQRLFVSTLLFMAALWGGVMVAIAGWFARPSLSRPLYAVWVVPAAWVLGVEWLAHQAVFGFSWGLIGYRLHAHDALRQLASLTGVYGLSFLVLAVNAVIASWFIALRRHTPRPVAATLIVLGLLVGGLQYGHHALRTGMSQSPRVRVALLQGAKTEYAVEDLTLEGLDRLYPGMIVEAVQGGADLVVLPESVWLRTLQADGTSSPMAINPVSAEDLGRQIAGWVRERPAHVILGLDVLAGGRIYNATTVWDRSRLAGYYRKRRLVPFAEYRPAVIGRFGPANRLHGPRFAYAPGQGPQLIRLGPLIAGMFICQEVMFPSLIRESVREGATLLVTTGNDGVFRSPIVAQELSHVAQFRAAEHRRYVVRSMKSGVSAVIDPWGRVVASAPVHARGIVTATATGMSGRTPYTRFGDWILGLCALLVLVSAARRRRLPPA